MADTSDGTQRCRTCGKTKPLDQFWSNGPDRPRRRDCIQCANEKREARWCIVERTCEGCGQLLRTKDRGAQTARFHMACRPRAALPTGLDHW
jgi:hypothetical protein